MSKAKTKSSSLDARQLYTLVEQAVVKSGKEARPYQFEVMLDTIGHFQEKLASVLIISPTGSGKTFMAFTILHCLEQLIGRKLVIGWCAMRRKLLTQAMKENGKLFKLTIVPVSMFDKDPPKVDILVVDEAHHDATKSMANIHEKAKPFFTLGLTATPERGDSAELLFAKIVRKAGIYELVRQGYLAKADHFTLPDWEPKTVAEAYRRNRKLFGKSIMFFHTRAECQGCVDHLSKYGVKAEIVDQRSDKEAQVDALEDGSLDVLVNMVILTEGLNLPALETVFVRDSNALVTEQIIGRVLRTYEGMQKKIVQSLDTPKHAAKIIPLRKQFSFLEDWTIKPLNFDEEVINAILSGTLDLWAVTKISAETEAVIDSLVNRKRRHPGSSDE